MPSRIKIRHNGGAKPNLAIGIGFDDPSDSTTNGLLGVPVPSSNALTVSGLVVNTTNVTIEGRVFQPGRAIEFDLAAPGVLAAGETVRDLYIDFPFTSALGVVDTVRVNVLLQRAEEAAAVETDVVSMVAPTSVLFTQGDKTKLNFLTLTQAANLDDLETDVAQHQTVLGVADGSVSLGSFTGTTIPDASTVKAALQVLETAQESQFGPVYNVSQFGAVYGSGVTKAVAQANADAIVAAYNAAYATGSNLPASGTGGSINRWLPPRIVISGHLVIAKPVRIDKQAPCVFVDGGNTGTIACYDRVTWETDWPGRYGLELGSDGNLNQAPMFTLLRGLTFSGFMRGVQLGFAPGNINMANMWCVDCQFVGPQAGHPNTLGVRVFNRSASVAFVRCMWDMYMRSLEVQSADAVTLENCRVQLGNAPLASTVIRPQTSGNITLRHGRLAIRGGVFNPPLLDIPLWVGSPPTSYAVDQYVRVPTLGNAVRRCITAHTSTSTYDASKFEDPPEWTDGIPNTDKHRYSWVHVADFATWSASTAYDPGDTILQPFDGAGGTGNPVYWSRLSYGTSGATWNSTERAAWQVIDSMLDWRAGEVVAANQIRRANDPADGRWKFFARNATGTAEAAFDATEKANWTVVGNSGASFTAYGTGSFTAHREAGQPISAWHWLDIDQQTLFGAESGGLTPVIWDAPPMPLYAAGVENRKLQTCCRVANNSCNSIVAYAEKVQSVNLVPAVLLRQIPNQLIIENNHFSGPSRAVAAMYDPLLSARPYLRCPNSTNYFSPQEAVASGNYCGTMGIQAFDSNSTPWVSSFYLYGPDWLPYELAAPILSQTLTADNPALVTDWAASTVVQAGELRALTINSVEKVYRSRDYRTTRTTLDATEQGFWQLVDDLTFAASGYHNVTLLRNNFYRSMNPTNWTFNSAQRFQSGRIITIYHQNNLCTYEHAVGRMRLANATNTTPSEGNILVFASIAGELWEIGRNYREDGALNLGTRNITTDTTTGTRIATATTQKLGFFNATPVVQQTLTTDLLDALQALGLIASGAGNTPLNLTSGALTCGAATVNGTLTLSAQNIATDTTTGMKLGTATTQKLGFFNKTPVVQPATVTDPTGGGTQDAEARTAINAIIDRLQELGLIA